MNSSSLSPFLIFGLVCSFNSTDVLAKNKPEETSADVHISNEKTKFSDAENGYSLEFPAGWSTQKDRIVNLVAAPLESFKSPNPIPNVKVVVRPIPDGHTLDTISDTAVKQWGAIWKVESDVHSKEGKTPTRRLVLVQTIPLSLGTEHKVQQTKVLKAFAANNGKYYIVSCAAYVDNFSNYEKTFTEIIDSLTLK
jgi:hypothetical protein